MSNYANILKQADIFYKLTIPQLESISNICSEKTYQAGEIVFLEGNNSDELYIIVQGEVDIQVNPALVIKPPDENITTRTITTLRRGQSFGEIALVDHGLRSATAKVIQDNSILIIIPRDKLNDLCESQPALGYRLMKNLAVDLAFKMRSTDLFLRENMLKELE